MRWGRTAAAIAAMSFALLVPATSQAGEPTVTRFEWTEAFVNTCRNDEIVIVNAVKVYSTRMTQTSTGLQYESRTWFADASAASNDGATSYEVRQRTVDGFRTTARRGVETITSLQGFELRLRPADRRGELRVEHLEALRTNLSTGDTRVLHTHDRARCS